MITEPVKYPRTPHFPWSPGASDDDILLENAQMFEGKQVVVTEKLDGENCLDENTIIHTEDGDKTIRWICEVKYEGKVLCYNIETGEDEWKNIINWWINEKCDDWYKIELEDGKVLILTSEHRVWLPDLNCYRKAKDLQGGEEIQLKK